MRRQGVTATKSNNHKVTCETIRALGLSQGALPRVWPTVARGTRAVEGFQGEGKVAQNKRRPVRPKTRHTCLQNWPPFAYHCRQQKDLRIQPSRNTLYTGGVFHSRWPRRNGHRYHTGDHRIHPGIRDCPKEELNSLTRADIRTRPHGTLRLQRMRTTMLRGPHVVLYIFPRLLPGRSGSNLWK